MGVTFDRWTFLKLVEVGFAVSCLISKRVTDDEASRLFLYLQRISREWSLLNNVTWDKLGAAVADATYGGYIIITASLFIGRLVGELPTQRRISEMVFLGVGAILYIVLGSLAFAALDSVPPDLVDNAAVLGTLSLLTAGLFFLDMGGPKARRTQTVSPTTQKISKPTVIDPKRLSEPAVDAEKGIKPTFETVILSEKPKKQEKQTKVKNGQMNGSGLMMERTKDDDKGISYRRMSDDKSKKFGIYGKDVEVDRDGSDTDEIDDTIPPKMQQHSPVWSNIRKGQYGRYDIVTPTFIYPKEDNDDRYPSSPGDPGYVQYTAQNWGQTGQKTPRQSPTQV